MDLNSGNCKGETSIYGLPYLCSWLYSQLAELEMNAAAALAAWQIPSNIVSSSEVVPRYFTFRSIFF